MSKQLQLVLELEQKKEQNMLIDFQKAQQAYLEQKQRQQGIFQYRQDYLKRIQQRGQAGIAVNTFGHLHGFVATLDTAEQKQMHTVGQAKAVMQQRKQRWLTQQQRTKAVQQLLDKKALQQQKRENKREQQLNDELALRQFFLP